MCVCVCVCVCREGGIRATGFIWGRGVPAGKNVTKLFHACDWLPTFVALAGGSVPATRRLDGYDIWAALTGKSCRSGSDDNDDVETDDSF